MDLRPILKVEKVLSTRLIHAWQPIARATFAQVQEAVAARDWKAAADFANALDMEHVGEKNRTQIKYLLLSAGLFGGRIARFGGDPKIAEGSFEGLLHKTATQFTNAIEQNVTRNARQKLLKLIADAQSGELVHKADGEPKRFVDEFVSFQEEGSRSLQLLSSLHSSRLAVWGFTAEAGVMGVDTYRLTAVLDGRTSPFCEMVDGTEFEVERARGRINEILSAENPDDLKTLAPWPDQSDASIQELSELSSEELAQRGYDVPPFHPWCRTLCALVDRVYEGEDQPVEDQPQEDRQPQTLQDFEAFGIQMSEEELAQWNEEIGVAPGEILSELTGISPDELIEQAQSGKVFSFGPDGELKMSVEGPLASEESLEELKQVYDPFSGKLFGSAMEFSATDEAAAAWIGGSYERMVSMAKELGGSQFIIEAEGEYSVFAHANMGFLPESIGAWEELATGIETDLAEGGALASLVTDSAEQEILSSLLNSSDPKALWALAQLPEGEKLLAGRTLTMRLPFDDAEAMGVFEDVLG